ncbi:hypothetical protein S7711_10938 [Stachybotrys chartarum IBT 7711]|uniref:Uncharacterized protein n=1 Tax=Stachybotrys chartarum (strain CBS 109288 / IBT 7711) TaxID=1280523 RepID=A0A084B996_STACB|nr:hypothetical protein S7711_10938 [Stachybotrys chartarum IBT 7711]
MAAVAVQQQARGGGHSSHRYAPVGRRTPPVVAAGNGKQRMTARLAPATAAAFSDKHGHHLAPLGTDICSHAVARGRDRQRPRNAISHADQHDFHSLQNRTASAGWVAQGWNRARAGPDRAVIGSFAGGSCGPWAPSPSPQLPLTAHLSHAANLPASIQLPLCLYAFKHRKPNQESRRDQSRYFSPVSSLRPPSARSYDAHAGPRATASPTAVLPVIKRPNNAVGMWKKNKDNQET